MDVPPPDPVRDTDWRLPAFRLAVGALVLGLVGLLGCGCAVLRTGGQIFRAWHLGP